MQKTKRYDDNALLKKRSFYDISPPKPLWYNTWWHVRNYEVWKRIQSCKKLIFKLWYDNFHDVAFIDTIVVCATYSHMTCFIDWVSLATSVSTLTPYALPSLRSPSSSLTLTRWPTSSSNVFGRRSNTIVIIHGEYLNSPVWLFRLV